MDLSLGGMPIQRDDLTPVIVDNSIAMLSESADHVQVKVLRIVNLEHIVIVGIVIMVSVSYVQVRSSVKRDEEVVTKLKGRESGFIDPNPSPCQIVSLLLKPVEIYVDEHGIEDIMIITCHEHSGTAYMAGVVNALNVGVGKDRVVFAIVVLIKGYLGSNIKLSS